MTATETSPTTTPAADGFRLQPDWAPQKRLLMAWPDDPAVWGEHLTGAQDVAVSLARAAAAFEPVSMVVHSSEVASVSLSCGGGVAAMPYAESAAWMRDAGPLFLAAADGRRACAVWHWRPEDRRPALGRALADDIGLPAYEAPLALERGALDVDEVGTALALEGPIHAANPGRSREELEGILRDFLGLEKIIWLPGGLATEGAQARTVDVARFAAPGVVLVTEEENQRDDNAAALAETRAALDGQRTAAGARIRVVGVPQPKPRKAGRVRLPLSYLNFARVNGCLMVPAFDDRKRDQAAQDAIIEAALDSRVESLPALELAHGGGGLHCLTLPDPTGA